MNLIKHLKKNIADHIFHKPGFEHTDVSHRAKKFPKVPKLT